MLFMRAGDCGCAVVMYTAVLPCSVAVRHNNDCEETRDAMFHVMYLIVAAWDSANWMRVLPCCRHGQQHSNDTHQCEYKR